MLTFLNQVNFIFKMLWTIQNFPESNDTTFVFIVHTWYHIFTVMCIFIGPTKHDRHLQERKIQTLSRYGPS